MTGIISQVDDEVPLEGGAVAEGIVRVGDTVRRPTGPWTHDVHAVLRHLEAVGYPHSPRVLGIDDRGREILAFIPGATVFPDHRDLLEDDDVLVRLGAFVAGLHRALPRHADGSMTLHGDLAPWNVLVDGDRFAAIDWDSTHRGEAAWEIAYCLFTFCNLWPDRALPPVHAVRRMRLFARGYGLDDGGLARAVGLMPDRLRDVARFLTEQSAAGVPGFVRMCAERHDEMWLDNATYAEEQLPSWLDVLGVTA